ncbi:E3 ubiquitin-protein ligase DTX3L [Callorhinchus milii]|uniref:E3 ubiquitin-protein ligase n=1 Tax=Callorhinchus milii TaxID=7868 RepID=A0A4W3JYQ9_CALMI|nr:E3 ubiquitin-protein ligase DTX3L [Callorhinchus milii]|eukprot:gi/632949868/ref/XP_007890397.1/ PREDICTED: E3 ubiquitin-protein ligase DTX3L-like [Callorhinchus milii]
MEVFPKVKAVIDLRIFKDRHEAYNIIHSNKAQCKIGANCYEVTGSFQEIDEIHTRLLKLKAVSCSVNPSAALSAPNHHAELCIDKIYFDYISAICSNQLRNIEQECNVAIKKTEIAGTCKIEFHSVSKSKMMSSAAKDRFITLYQRVATNFDLKTIELRNFSKETTEKGIRAFLQKEYPKVVVEFKGPKLTLAGSPSETKRAEIALLSNKCQGNRLKSATNAAASNMDITDSSTKPLSSPSHHKTKSISAAASSKLDSKAEDKTCPVCLDEINERETLKKCKHSFCRECIKAAFRVKSACPICGEVYGELMGNQPQAGTMKSYTTGIHLPGYEKYDTIVINYAIPDGIQQPEHPSPGQRYTGTGRIAYLPDTLEGRKVHKLLERAFNQRLVFTIGTSSTTGRSNVVTWNDIHHKTSTSGGPSMYGYPDPTYLDRVQDELKAKGIH